MDTSSSNSVEPERQRWASCQPGELQRMAAQIRANHRSRMLNRATVAVAVLAVAGLGAYYLWNSMSATPQAITCKEVVDHMVAYAAGNVDAELKARIDYHLTYCNSCRERYHQFGLVADALQPAFPLATSLFRALR